MEITGLDHHSAPGAKALARRACRTHAGRSGVAGPPGLRGRAEPPRSSPRPRADAGIAGRSWAPARTERASGTHRTRSERDRTEHGESDSGHYDMCMT